MSLKLPPNDEKKSSCVIPNGFNKNIFRITNSFDVPSRGDAPTSQERSYI